MEVRLFGVGTRSQSPAITAQRRINCHVDVRKTPDKTSYALIGRGGFQNFASPSSSVTRGEWSVNSLNSPTLFVVQGMNVYAINNAGVISIIGTISTSSGDVSMTDNGVYLMIVDGQFGYYYNMSGGTLTKITDGNFTSSPKYVTFQDTYFIVTSGSSNQFQLSNNADPTTWPAVNINFTGFAGSLQAGIADHSILQLFGQDYVEFWQDAGSPDFPYAKIPGAAQEVGLVSPWSLVKFDNSLVGLFRSKQGQVFVGRMKGFSVARISDRDIDKILSNYSVITDAQGLSFQLDGAPMYVFNLPTAGVSYMFDPTSGIWTELQATDGSAYWGTKSAFLVDQTIINDRRNGNLYLLDDNTWTDNASILPMEVVTQHIWNQDKYIGIGRIQIDVEAGHNSVPANTPKSNTDLNIILSTTYTPSIGSNTWVSDAGVLAQGVQLTKVSGVPGVNQYSVNDATHTYTFNVANGGQTANVSYYTLSTAPRAPVMDLQVSKDGGNSFYSVGYSSVGAVGEFTVRTVWNSLGAARDWVLKLRITDATKRIITGATAEVQGGAF